MAKSHLLNTRTTNYLELIGNGKTYRVPPYQRDYSWSEEQWEDLWNDVIDLRQDPETAKGTDRKTSISFSPCPPPASFIGQAADDGDERHKPTCSHRPREALQPRRWHFPSRST